MITSYLIIAFYSFSYFLFGDQTFLSERLIAGWLVVGGVSAVDFADDSIFCWVMGAVGAALFV